MKRICCNNILLAVLLIAGLLFIGFSLASCGKPKTAEKPAEEEGYRLTTKPAQTLPGKVMQKGMEPKCESNLSQIRSFIMMYKDENESYPPNLAAIPEAARILKCPVSKQPYTYDPQTGQVWCTFPGHEKL